MIAAGMIAALVAAPGAMAGRAHHTSATTGAARDFFSSFDRPERSDGLQTRDNSFQNTRTNTIHNSASCSTSVEASTDGDVKDLYIEAISESYSSLCEGVDPSSDRNVTKIIWDKPAYAFASALAEAEGTCTTVGDALGCFTASATAGKWTEAFAGAYAEAYAEAIKDSECRVCPNGAPGPATATAEATAGATAKIFLQLATDAVSSAAARGCAEGDDEAYAKAYSNCYVQTIAIMSTKAMADSFASGDCEVGGATADVFADVEARTRILEECILNSEFSGAATANTDGSRANGRITEH